MDDALVQLVGFQPSPGRIDAVDEHRHARPAWNDDNGFVVGVGLTGKAEHAGESK